MIGGTDIQGMFVSDIGISTRVMVICRCVNAISWAQHGELLLTGGDDTTCVCLQVTFDFHFTLILVYSVCLWRVDPTDPESDYPLVNTSVIETGHVANIFAAHMLPYSTRMYMCATIYYHTALFTPFVEPPVLVMPPFESQT
jgi:hypothetical protein